MDTVKPSATDAVTAVRRNQVLSGTFHLSLDRNGPPSPRPSSAGEGARLTPAMNRSRSPRLNRIQARRRMLSASIRFVALPLLGERAGVRADFLDRRSGLSLLNPCPSVVENL